MNSNSDSTAAPPPAPIRLGKVLIIVVALVVIGLAVGFIPRWLSRQRLDAAAKADSTLTVEVVSPVAGKPDFGAPLPAEVEPFVQASIHSRASGYLKNWFVDIGDVVTNGQLLAEIDTPELDQQIDQAKAQVNQAKAALDLAQVTADRWTELLKTASVSEQETIEKTSDLALKKADFAAAQANWRRLEELKDFDRITAPFAGTITARNTDIGQLINAGSGPELFRLAQVNTLRVYVQVPQPLIHYVKPGQKAALTFQEMPGRAFEATVTRTAGAVDPATRTLQVELQVDNSKGEILAGSYAQASFKEGAAETSVLTIPDNALLFRAQGMQLALVDKNNKVHLQDVRLGRDFGNTIEVLSGLKTGDRVINNPPDSIAEGETVQIATPEETNSAAQ